MHAKRYAHLVEQHRLAGLFPSLVAERLAPLPADLLSQEVDQAANEAGGDLIWHGGRTVVGGRLYNIYLGNPSVNVQDFDAFTKHICENGYYLSPDQKDKSPTTFLGSKVINPSPLPANVGDFSIQGWLDTAIANGQLPADDGKTIYSIIMPPGSVVTMGGQQSCSSFCGYHSDSPKGHLYQVICDSACSGCHGSFLSTEGRMMVQAHEYTEVRSDPYGDAWYDGNGWENADKCAWQRIFWGPSVSGWTVQPQHVNGLGCFTGAYIPDNAPPPPPPPVPNPPPPPPPVPNPPPPTPQPPVTATIALTYKTASGKLGAVIVPAFPVDSSIVQMSGTIIYSNGKRTSFSVGFSRLFASILRFLR